MNACFCCGAQVEAVLLEIDGSLHSCPPADLARWFSGHRKVVDEGWWARLQAPPDVPVSEEPATPVVRRRYSGEL